MSVFDVDNCMYPHQLVMMVDGTELPIKLHFLKVDFRFFLQGPLQSLTSGTHVQSPALQQ